MSGEFSSVLVANRGEIAVRVLRSAADAGYRTIAVFSTADAGAPHVALADEAVCIGPAPVRESYLDPQRILDAAARSGATAVHPGYGFLSENAQFARACADAGLVFIGPSPDAIELMGNKAAAKRRMLDAGVPCIPGYQSEEQSDEALLAAAQEIGLPLMVKAAAGGGGRGMRLVESIDDLTGAIAAARSEALNAFGSGELILERAVLRPRHVEIQVFGDRHGNVIHLGERDCSMQRRHQKVIEEAPCPVMSPALREAMGEAAVAAARSIDYAGAGTVEFLLDDAGNFYFLEMNTRLQVEHPVTEAITGLDLVDWQLRVARGEALPCGQDEITLRGHAIEARLYAEDTANDFLPASGTALVWQPPTGEGIRVDHGLRSGQEVSPFYDPMIAKIVAVAGDRETARRRLLRALHNTVIFGMHTNREFLMDALGRECFRRGETTTAFIAEEYAHGVARRDPDAEVLSLAALLQHLQGLKASQDSRVFADAHLAGGEQRLASTVAYQAGDAQQPVILTPLADGAYRARLGEQDVELTLVELSAQGWLRVTVDGIQHTVAFCFPSPASVSLQVRGCAHTLVNELASHASRQGDAGSGSVLAPMHGNVLGIRVAVGDAVCVGDELAVMEAMKMEHRLLAQIDGVVSVIHGVEGQQLAAGAVVLEIQPGDTADVPA